MLLTGGEEWAATLKRKPGWSGSPFGAGGAVRISGSDATRSVAIAIVVTVVVAITVPVAMPVAVTIMILMVTPIPVASLVFSR
jgi:hypothetical protein